MSEQKSWEHRRAIMESLTGSVDISDLTKDDLKQLSESFSQLSQRKSAEGHWINPLNDTNRELPEVVREAASLAKNYNYAPFDVRNPLDRKGEWISVRSTNGAAGRDISLFQRNVAIRSDIVDFASEITPFNVAERIANSLRSVELTKKEADAIKFAVDQRTRKVKRHSAKLIRINQLVDDSGRHDELSYVFGCVDCSSTIRTKSQTSFLWDDECPGKST